MASLLIHIGVGGVVGASGALIGGLIVLGLRTFLTKRARARNLEMIRQIGLLEACRHQLFDEPQPELDFRKRATG
jgi:hypothetical protein